MHDINDIIHAAEELARSANAHQQASFRNRDSFTVEERNKIRREMVDAEHRVREVLRPA